MDSPIQRRRICIAEDNPDLRQIFSAVFDAAGFDVYTARDGQETLRCLYTNPPDALVLDVNMPGQNGLDILKHIREETQLRKLLRLKVVLVTGNPTALMNAEAGMADVILMKPVDVFELLDLVRRMLGCEAKPPSAASLAG
ncbi:MAG: response regulator [Candidatus Flexifilum sp.]|jgi:CheY-like chemotaxis protein